MGILYATREQVSASPEILESAYSGTQIDATIDAASRSAEGFLHRRFYPELRTILKDWPNRAGSPTWEVELGDQEMISTSLVTSGGIDITANVILRRGDDLAEPPYSRLQIDLTSNAAFSASTSWQRSLSIRGLFGANDTSTALAGSQTSGSIATTSVATITLVPINGLFTPGIGSLLLCESERMLVVDRRMITSAQTITSSPTASMADRSFTSAGAANFVKGEIILIDSERMRINDIAGTTVTVTRAWDGTALAAHTSGATIFGLRSYTVIRGALGSTAATHSTALPVYVHAYPALLTELVVAETIVMLTNRSAGYARTIGSGAGTREAAGLGLDDIRERAWRELGRKNRSAAI